MDKRSGIGIFSVVGIASLFSLFILPVSYGAVTPAKQAEAPQPSITLQNLQAAFNGESNANRKYLAFAEKADAEGFPRVASLFRAAAKAEEIHMQNHAAVIKGMGAEPKADIQQPEVKSTRENLEAAIRGELYEKDDMYPIFIKQAQTEGNSQAVRTFKWAAKAEMEHSKLFSDVLTTPDSWKSGPKDYLVCSECGYTTIDMSLTKCPVCAYPRSKILTIN